MTSVHDFVDDIFLMFRQRRSDASIALKYAERVREAEIFDEGRGEGFVCAHNPAYLLVCIVCIVCIVYIVWYSVYSVV